MWSVVQYPAETEREEDDEELSRSKPNQSSQHQHLSRCETEFLNLQIPHPLLKFQFKKKVEDFCKQKLFSPPASASLPGCSSQSWQTCCSSPATKFSEKGNIISQGQIMKIKIEEGLLMLTNWAKKSVGRYSRISTHVSCHLVKVGVLTIGTGDTSVVSWHQVSPWTLEDTARLGNLGKQEHTCDTAEKVAA